MMSLRHPSRLRFLNRPGRGWAAAIAVALVMAGAAMAQGGMSKSTERLFDAVFKNDMTAVKSSIPAGAKLDAVNSWGQTPVDLAVDLGYFEIAHFLTSLRRFKLKEEEETRQARVSAANSFLNPGFRPLPALEPLSPSLPAPAPAMPPPRPGGAFDPSIASQGSVLAVIGDIRVPDGTAAPEILTPSPVIPPLAAARVVAAPAVKAVPTAPPKPSLPPSPARPAAPASPVEAAPAREDSGFISNLWGQLADAFSEEPEEIAEAPSAPEPVASAAVDEESGFISNILGQLKEAFSSPPEAEGKEEPVVAFGQAKPSPENTEDMAKAEDAPFQLTLPPSPAETVADIPTEPSVSPSSPENAGSEEEESFSDILEQLKEAFSAAPDDESAKKPVVAFSQAKPSPEGTEAAKKTDESKPSFTDRLANFLSLDIDSLPRVKKRKRSRLRTDTAMIGFPEATKPSEFLKGVALNLIGESDLGKPAPPLESCIPKNRGKVLFCIEPVAWPELMEPHFKVSTFMYGGAKSIVRYDDGKATFVHALFPSASYEAVIDHFQRRFGPPTDQQELWLSSLSSPARSNTISAWWSIEGSSVTSLQIRKYDDTRGGFPDMEYGAISLHIQGAKPIFPLLSTANLMLLKFKRTPKRLP